MRKTDRKNRIILLLMAALLVICILASFSFGRYPVPLHELLGILGSKLGLPIEQFWTKQMETAVWNIRMP